MKRILLIAALALSPAIALAGGWGTTNQGGQGGSASAGASATNNSTNVNVVKPTQGQMQGQAINNNQVYQEVSQAPGIAAGNCDAAVSIGTNGTLSGNLIPLSAGGCWQTRTGNAGRIAALYIAAGANARAIQVLDNTAVAKRARGASGIVTRTSTRSAPQARPDVAYNKCEMRDGAIHVKPKSKSVTDLAVSQCRAHLAG